jgi:hypothetical protein
VVLRGEFVECLLVLGVVDEARLALGLSDVEEVIDDLRLLVVVTGVLIV